MWRKVVPFLEAKAPVTRVDTGLVELYCTQYEIYRKAYQSIIDDGIQTKIFDSLQDSTGAIVGKDFVGYKRNPATQVYNDSLKQLNAVGEQLGLSPKGRAELAKIAPPEKDSDDIAAQMQKFLGGNDH